MRRVVPTRVLPLRRDSPPPPPPPKPRNGWNGLLVGVLALGLVAFVVLMSTDPACLLYQHWPHCASAPSPQTPPPTQFTLTESVYGTSTPFVYAATWYPTATDVVQYVSVRWDEAGVVRHPVDFSEFQSVEACPGVKCSLVLVINSTHVVDVLRFEGFLVEHIYANETYVTATGVGASFANSGWTIPNSEQTIERGHLGRAAAMFVYERLLTTGGLFYALSALVLEPADAFLVDLETNKGAVGNERLYFPFSGACMGENSWVITPLQVEQGAATAADLTMSCVDYQAAVLVFKDPGPAEMVWNTHGPNDASAPLANVYFAASEGTSYVVVYGVYGADESATFPVPAFSSVFPAGAIPVVGAPTELDPAWSTAWSAGYAIRYGSADHVFVDAGRLEVVLRNVEFTSNGAAMTMCGDTVEFTHLDVFEFSSTALTALHGITDADATTTSPFCCEWDYATGAVNKCVLYRGTADTVVTSVSPFVFTSLTPGDVQASDAVVALDNVTYVGEPTYNVTLPSFADGISQSNYGGLFDDGSLISDVGATERSGQYVVIPGITTVWYAVSGGILKWAD